LSYTEKRNEPEAVHIVREGPLGIGTQAFLAATGRQFTTSYRTHLDKFVSARFPEGLQKTAEQIIQRYLVGFHNRSSNVMVTTEDIANDLKEKGLLTPTSIVPQAGEEEL